MKIFIFREIIIPTGLTRKFDKILLDKNLLSKDDLACYGRKKKTDKSWGIT